ncbi:hypothetical protein FGO68_gene16510 [Halteria grandinella]|uniref:Uncharacterized protein n=1 Tax=Halteria grandinella TaxID=5974 RepID=A0A8J8P7I1_HALGN|nr:hypothetical protein FGO68_gene16510 [Halteria grandinella]
MVMMRYLFAFARHLSLIIYQTYNLFYYTTNCLYYHANPNVLLSPTNCVWHASNKLINASPTLLPFCALVSQYSHPFPFAHFCASLELTSLLPLLSALLPHTTTLRRPISMPADFLISSSQWTRELKESLFSRSKTIRQPQASAQNSERIRRQSSLPLMSKKLMATVWPLILSFLTPQSIPIVWIQRSTNFSSQQRLIRHDFPTSAFPTEMILKDTCSVGGQHEQLDCGGGG